MVEQYPRRGSFWEFQKYLNLSRLVMNASKNSERLLNPLWQCPACNYRLCNECLEAQNTRRVPHLAYNPDMAESGFFLFLFDSWKRNLGELLSLMRRISFRAFKSFFMKYPNWSWHWSIWLGWSDFVRPLRIQANITPNEKKAIWWKSKVLPNMPNFSTPSLEPRLRKSEMTERIR